MIRRDCAYCIDLEEHGALCDHPCRLDGGEPVDISVCPPRCNTYEKRLSSYEMRERIRKLESELRDARHSLDRQSSRDVTLTVERERLNAENKKLMELVHDLVMLPSVPAFDCCGCRYERHHDCGVFGCKLVERARELGIEVEQ